MSSIEDKIKIVCPKCSTKQYVDKTKAFSKINCESCAVRFTVPKVFGNIMLHDVISNDEFSSSHTGTHLTEGHHNRIRIFNEKLIKNEEVVDLLKQQIRRQNEKELEACLKILSYGFMGDEFFIESENNDKGSLKSRMTNQKVSQKAALEFSISIGECLLEAHQNNLIFGNLKTSNIRCLKNRQVKLTDCSLTWLVASTLSEKGSNIEPFNNLPYLAPETASRKIVNKSSDIYNFGCIVYELITKVSPFEEYVSREAIIKAHCEKEPMDLLKRKPCLPADVSKMVMRMLAKDPVDRPSDIKEIIDCFKINLNDVEEIQVEEIKNEFGTPSSDKTLRPRPSAEIDLNLLSGDEGPVVVANLQSVTSDKMPVVTDDDGELEDDSEEELKLNTKVKLQDTEFNMDFGDLASLSTEKKPKAILYILVLFIVIVIAAIIFIVIQGNGDREQLKLPIEKSLY